jgi:hypothetical protein
VRTLRTAGGGNANTATLSMATLGGTTPSPPASFPTRSTPKTCQESYLRRKHDPAAPATPRCQPTRSQTGDQVEQSRLRTPTAKPGNTRRHAVAPQANRARPDHGVSGPMPGLLFRCRSIRAGARLSSTLWWSTPTPARTSTAAKPKRWPPSFRLTRARRTKFAWEVPLPEVRVGASPQVQQRHSWP